MFKDLCLIRHQVTSELRLDHDPALSLCPSAKAALLISVLHAYLQIRKLHQTYYKSRYHCMCKTNISSCDAQHSPIDVDTAMITHSHFAHMQNKTRKG